MVRYSEIVQGIGEKNTITAFFIPNKERNKIDKIYFVETSSIIAFLQITIVDAEILSRLNKRMPRSLNCQASATITDIAALSFYTHYFE